MLKASLIKAGFLGMLLASTIIAHADDYTVTTNNGAITITGYTGAGGDVTIPETINGLPVTEVGTDAFYQNSNITSLTVPDSVLNIKDWAFSWAGLSSVTIGNGCTNIGGSAFSECSSLTNVTFGANVANLGAQLFFFTSSLESVYFYGDAPTLGDADVFFGCDNATAYYISGKTGWGSTLGGIPTATWTSPPAATPDIIIDFESYTTGIAPPAPWTILGDNNTTTDQVRVSNAQAHSGANSLAVIWNDHDRARYPFAVDPGESASFSVWVRPSFTEANALAAYVAVLPSNTNRDRTLQFKRDWHVYDGSSRYSMHWVAGGGIKSVQGDYTSSTWHLVTGEITPTEITLSTTTESGLLTYSFDRMGETITAIELGYASGYESELRTAYYDDLTIIPPRDDVTLTVASALGSPTPAVGTTTNSWGSTATCSVAHVDADTTQYECIGWTGTGSVPATGTTNAVDVTLTEHSSITWQWQTNYWLDVSVSGSGTVSHVDGFYAKDSEQILSATPDSGWLFMYWTGDASGTNDEAFVMMTAPQSVTAVFSDDADDDGLTNNEEAALGTNPRKADTDNDGFDDKTEVDYGLSPTVDSSGLVDFIANNGDTFGLYSSNVVLDVAMGEILLETSGTEAILNLQLEASDDLVTWTNAGDAVEWIWTVGEEKKFFRVRSAK